MPRQTSAFLLLLLLSAPVGLVLAEDGDASLTLWLVGDGSDTVITDPADPMRPTNFALSSAGHGGQLTYFTHGYAGETTQDEDPFHPTFIGDEPVSVGADSSVTLTAFVDYGFPNGFVIACPVSAALFGPDGAMLAGADTRTTVPGTGVLGSFEEVTFTFDVPAGDYAFLKVQLGNFGADCGQFPTTWGWGSDEVPARLVVSGSSSPNLPPNAVFTATVTEATVSVDGAASSDPDGDALSFSWAFGDGGSAAGATASHAYAETGDYAITLTVSDGRGGSGQATQTVHVDVPAAEGPSIEITSPADGSAFTGGTLAVSGTYDPGTGGTDPCGDCNSDGWVVVAVVDTGINPYSSDFAAVAGQPATHPSTYIEGFPATAPAIDLECTATAAIPAACAGDFAGIAQGELRWIPGTKLVGAISFETVAPFGPTRILDDDGHGTGSASVGFGHAFGTCAECLVVVVEGFAGLTWASSQPWIDLVSNSWGTRANVGAPGGIVNLNGNLDEIAVTRAFTEAGGTTLWASGNGAENAFVLPIQTYSSPYTGPDWHFVVGGATTGNDGADEARTGEQVLLAAGKPALVASYASGVIPAACFNSLALTCAHSGTSSATPITAGAMGSVLAKARAMLGDTTEGPAGSGNAADGQAVAGNPYLADGALSRQELWDLVAKTAGDQDFGWITVPATLGHTGTPVDPAVAGYGIVNAWTRDDAVALLEGGLPLPDRSDVDAFMEQDSALRHELWGTWDGQRFSTGAAAAAPASGQEVPGLVLPAEPVNDGTIPGVWGEIGDVAASNDATHLELRLALGGLLDGAVPTVLGTPFTYQASLRTTHNLAGGIEYRATYEYDAPGTDLFGFVAVTAADAGGIASLCPVETDLSQSRYDAANATIVWRVPLAALDHDNLPVRGAGDCALFTREGRGLEHGDVLDAIHGEAAVKLGVVSIGGIGDASEGSDHTIVTGDVEEPPACDRVSEVFVEVAGQPGLVRCVGLDPAAELAWSVSFEGLALAPGTYAINASAWDADGALLDLDHVFFVVPVADTDGDGVRDDLDAFPSDPAEWADTDADGVGDNGDAFPADPLESKDSDADGTGDNSDACAGHDDRADLDADGTADGCDPDLDGDLLPNAADNCPAAANPGQENLDGDHRGDACDSDRDGDGASNDRELARGTDPDDPGSHP